MFLGFFKTQLMLLKLSADTLVVRLLDRVVAFLDHLFFFLGKFLARQLLMQDLARLRSEIVETLRVAVSFWRTQLCFEPVQVLVPDRFANETYCVFAFLVVVLKTDIGNSVVDIL